MELLVIAPVTTIHLTSSNHWPRKNKKSSITSSKSTIIDQLEIIELSFL
jgi:hypothetical protein